MNYNADSTLETLIKRERAAEHLSTEYIHDLTPLTSNISMYGVFRTDGYHSKDSLAAEFDVLRIDELPSLLLYEEKFPIEEFPELYYAQSVSPIKEFNTMINTFNNRSKDIPLSELKLLLDEMYLLLVDEPYSSNNL